MISPDELREILDAHARWANGDASGCRADLSGADLRRADLRSANLSGANLSGADLRCADLRSANLHRTYLRGANLHRTYLRGADLSCADLRGADLSCADLRGATVDDAIWDYMTVGIHPAPQGELRVWGRKGGKIVEMIVPADARRSCATTRKMRAEYVYVVSVEGGGEAVVTDRWGTTIYRAGQRVRCHEWCEDRWQECAGGIHFFLTREEAEAWQ